MSNYGPNLRSLRFGSPRGKYSYYYEFTLTGAGASSTVLELFTPIEESREKRERPDQPTITTKKQPADVLKFQKKDDTKK